MTTGKEREMTKFNDGADVGDIMVCSWGYDQTNVDFYKVTRRTKASAWIVKVGQKMVAGSEGFMSEQVLPDPENVLPWHIWNTDGQPEKTCEPKMKRVRSYNGKAVITMTSYSHAFPYEGGSMYQSHYA